MQSKLVKALVDIETLDFLRSSRPGQSDSAIVRDALRHLAIIDSQQPAPKGITSVPIECVPAAANFLDHLNKMVGKNVAS